jgi:predicted transcriptional regulator
MFKLYEYGELNQSKLMSYCGLNNVKHKGIIDDLVEKEFIVRIEEMWEDYYQIQNFRKRAGNSKRNLGTL